MALQDEGDVGRVHVKNTFESKAFHSNPEGVRKIQQGYRIQLKGVFFDFESKAFSS